MTNEQAFAAARELTAANAHQEAVLLIAEHFRVWKVADAVNGVMAIHKVRGHMDQPMIEMMQILRSDLYAAVEAAHGTEVRKAVYACF